MGVSVSQDEVYHQLVVLTLIEEWTWREFDRALDEALRLMQQTLDEVRLILDFSRTTYFNAPGIVENFKKSEAKFQHMTNYTLCVTVIHEKGLVDLLLNIIRMYGSPQREYLFAYSFDEARRIVIEQSISRT
jgi:hypothetical protein